MKVDRLFDDLAAAAQRKALLSALHADRQASAGDMQAIQDVVSAYPDVVVLSETGKTADGFMLVHYLCRSGNAGAEAEQGTATLTAAATAGLVSLLVNDRPEVLQRRDAHGYFPLHLALERAPSNVNLIRALVEGRPSTTLDAGPGGDLPLHLAIQTRAPESVIRLLVTAGPHALRMRDALGSLPLHLASELSNEDVVYFLLMSDPRALRRKDGLGRLPLHCATTTDDNRHLTQRPYPRALRRRDGRGHLPMHQATTDGRRPTVVQTVASHYRPALRIPNGDGWLPLHLACRSSGDVTGEVRFVAHLGPRALRRPTRDGKRWVPLHILALRRFSLASDRRRATTDIAAICEIVDLWPRALRARDVHGCLPLHYAAVRSPSEVVRHFALTWPPALQVPTADTNALPLHLAAPARDVELVRFLADSYPPALRARDANGQLPLHCCVASVASRLDAVRFFGGAFPGALREKDNMGWLPLHHAAAGESEPAVLFLVEQWSGALLQRTNDEGLLPLHIAAKARSSLLTVVQLLAEAQPSALQVRSNDGSLPLHLAAAAAAAVTEDSFVAKIEYLANASPHALEVSDSRGLKPVHVAATHHAPLDAIFLLARMDPAAALRLGRPQAPERAFAAAAAALHSPERRTGCCARCTTRCATL